ncbi:GNAT family N-acetyltransferase [Actinopolymorpha pittospori]|uniref:Acetyltransferase n=1 Tax=Actinopolymorpha pittospori TaxID=648752 RepID=A0A927MQZ0_9ACTN|nr:N-acetyltransferase [Actinopolymorpha pittospori]MBE1603623.1 putative acetyltransferase [Actinopolymorpha pittospori]
MTISCAVRPETAADIARIADVTRLAFGERQIEVDMVAAIRTSDEYVPELSLVAEVDGTVVGHCMLGRKALLGVTAPPVLALGPLSVLPSWQRRGIGSQLVSTAQQVATHRGKEALIVLLGEPDYYPRFGFLPARDFGIQPDWPAAMVYPLVIDLTDYRGAEIPH